MSARPALLAIMLALCALQPVAADETVHKGLFSMEITLGEKFFERLEKQGEELDTEASSFLIDPVRGSMHFAPGLARLDMAYGSLHNATTIVDRRQHRMLVLDHAAARAYSTVLEDYEAEMAADGLPLISPEQFFMHWPSLRDSIEAIPGLRRTELGRREVSGLNCSGISWKAPLSSVTSADGIQIVPDLPVLRTLDGEWQATFWISEKHDLPVKLTMDFCGISLSWQMTAFEPASGAAVLFRVPRAYKVEEVPASVLP